MLLPKRVKPYPSIHDFALKDYLMDKRLSEASIQELEMEIARRGLSRPDRIIHANWTSVANYVQDAIHALDRGDDLPKDFEHFLMETVLEAMYGKDIWIWWNSNVKT